MIHKIGVLLILAVLIFTPTARGHHGWTVFDATTTVTMSGTVTAFRFVSPHAVVEFDVKESKGQIENWQGELTSALRLSRKGWTAVSLEPGDVIRVTGNRAKSGVRVMRILKIVSADGKELNDEDGN